jgi:sporulation protein YlmC with PRC-barrel domain
MPTNQQIENSRVSEGALRTDRTQSEIANMIAEGGPATQEGSTPAAESPAIQGLAAASTLLGRRVLKAAAGEELGTIEEIMLNLLNGRIEYAVLSFTGFPGISNKRFPVHWNALRIDPGAQDLVLDIDRNMLEGAPHFDKDNWPDMADPAFSRVVYTHYGTTPDQRWRH